MARPREFDRDQALKLAMVVFREHGYEGSTTDELLRAMGIGRQSMYDAFGDKHRLYLEAIQLYEREAASRFAESIDRSPSPLRAIRDHFLSIADETPRDLSMGCLFVNATTELVPSDPEVTELVLAMSSRCLIGFETLLGRAKRRGELDPSLDERAAANFLLSTMRGLRVSAKAGVSTDDLRKIAELALSSIMPR